MARETTTYPETRDDWRRLIAPLLANSAELPHLELPRMELEGIIAEVSDLLARQSALTASKQEVSKRLQTLVVDGRRLAAFLRSGVKQRYGPRSEKLAEFNLQPFRGRKPAEQPEKGKKDKTPPVEIIPDTAA